MTNKNINITYETLFELSRREKTRDELQEINNTFFLDLVEYLKEKQDLLQRQKTKQDIFSEKEKEKTEKQLENIKKIIKELYERREKKIINMALDASRTPSISINTKPMLEEEKIFYEKVLKLLNNFRKNVLINIQQAKKPNIEYKNPVKPKKQQKNNQKQKSTLKSLKITHALPRFLGPNLDEYGPFEKDEKVKLPSKIADVLINKDRAEET